MSSGRSLGATSSAGGLTSNTGTGDHQFTALFFNQVYQRMHRVPGGDCRCVGNAGLFQQLLCGLQYMFTGGITDVVQCRRVGQGHHFIEAGGLLHIGQQELGL